MQQLIARNAILSRAFETARGHLPDTRAFTQRLGPGLITGAADDDPSGIATYSQAGSQFRFGLVWTLLLTTPLMIGIQMLSARIGWVTGEGLAANIAKVCPRWLTMGLVALLVVANTINIAADIGAMAEAARLLMGGPRVLFIVGFGAACVLGQVFFSYERSVRILKWLTLALFSYFAVVMVVHVPWHQATIESLQPWAFFPAEARLGDYASMVVAVLGTTISPYLFFWQAAQEVEDQQKRPHAAELRPLPAYAQEHLFRIKQDTYIGMSFSNIIALCIVLATAVTLNMHGITNIQTSSEAAEALRPVAGEFAFAVFALGIVGTGLLAVPVLAGSAAYAVSEAFGWKASLSHGFHEARGFYAIIIAATGIGTLMSLFELDPIKALVWSAIVNGVISVPIMVAMMWIGQSPRVMGSLTMSGRHRFFGWAATGVMAVAVVVMFVTA
ncbi:NRAMP family divalent metal transporter [Roseateles saccharophilus]|uniref:NRAMP (Natural resistance-associated macrophage protein)-like metal ion transporter n=1 Tax=Roseateles saccharophilus TaxID=304 RepID=A0A4R3VAV7_ROSSA|nr:divalent metal cation transporter [Roseateles saccharophilus]TCV01171.1 NRAMP (natural resistance-associated macrophage protein)-like metal ion transporter [Roseateles saccharophilus]